MSRMKFLGLFLPLSLGVFLSLPAWTQTGTDNNPPQGGDFSNNMNGPKVPANTIIVKGAWASATDSTTPVPEGGDVAGNVYANKYFGLSYPIYPEFYEKHKGPPPSDSGQYVLTQLRPTESFKGPVKANVLVTAQDMFFSLIPANNALELIKYTSSSLTKQLDSTNQPIYKVERPPTVVKIANHNFVRMDYVSPIAEVHWFTLSTQIRCHTVEFVISSRSPEMMESMIQDMNKMKLPGEADAATGAGGGDFPVCIKDYATSEHVINRVDPIFTERRYNAVPVRIIIGKDGKVKHIHLLSAFPDQSKAVTDAVMQWTFKPYLQNGQPVEVETGIMFGRQAPIRNKPPAASPAKPATKATNVS